MKLDEENFDEIEEHIRGFLERNLRIEIYQDGYSFTAMMYLCGTCISASQYIAHN